MSLSGRRIWIPRGGQWGQEFAELLRRSGADPVIQPVIDFQSADTPALAAALADLQIGRFEWLIVTSANTVKVLDFPLPPTVKIAAVGPATAAALARAGRRVFLQPTKDFSAEGLLRTILQHLDSQSPREGSPNPITCPGASFLLLTSDLAEETLTAGLAAAGYQVRSEVAYRTLIVSPPPQFDPLNFSAAVVTSGSMAEGIRQVLDLDNSGRPPASHSAAALFSVIPQAPALVCLGEKTAAACRRLGLEPAAIAPQKTQLGLLEALENLELN